MTYEEAKDVLINITVRFGRSQGKTQFVQAWEKALEAIEKQIPKKPITSTHKYIMGNTREEGEYKLTHCPHCWENKEIGYFDSLVDKGTKYCRRCGQAIDWSEAK